MTTDERFEAWWDANQKDWECFEISKEQIKAIWLNGFDIGYSDGCESGYDNGYDNGYESGYEYGRDT